MTIGNVIIATSSRISVDVLRDIVYCVAFINEIEAMIGKRGFLEKLLRAILTKMRNDSDSDVSSGGFRGKKIYNRIPLKIENSC